MTEANNLALSGKRVLVTGGSKGIGRSIALTLAEAGADVAITARNQAGLDAVATEVEAMGQTALALTCDVTDRAQIQVMAETVLTEFGGIDILVNNAGQAKSHKFVTHPDEMWDHLIAVNLTSAYLITKAFAAGMVEQQWGRIINIGSIAAKVGERYIAAYTASKHGLLGLTRSLAMEFVGDNITVNAICPGYVDTPLTDSSVTNIAGRTGMSEEEARSILEGFSPQKRLIEPEEVAAIALLLAQESGRSITGQGINVDGGKVMF